ncbi:MAG: glutathione peroxidase [Schleiferiaceae bacterium]
MKRILSLLSFVLLFSCSNGTQESTSNTLAMSAPPIDFYTLNATTIEGQPFSFSSLKGKRILIVNTASKCGYTPQYEDLEKLYRTYGGDNFTVIGFPSNDFGWQEPGSEEEIVAFCSSKYDVTFPMMSKVKTGANRGDDIYQWLCNKEQNGVSDAKVSWNFNKFLIDENGQWVAHFPSSTSPMSMEITTFAAGK